MQEQAGFGCGTGRFCSEAVAAAASSSSDTIEDIRVYMSPKVFPYSKQTPMGSQYNL